ncbi:hypothetical protein XF_2036 [Xylella fastidiosa 9a5c]|uniref:Uncharacterized protein n=2 Tax=Xylella fastidiosa TaxID=2371 RepID=Q9PBU9_XYLFA|nr:hypothetical protein XF_2036 [Xylella fastidiosa 9a5c]
MTVNRMVTETATEVRLYEAESPVAIPWRELRHGPLAEALVRPYFGKRSSALITNTDHHVMLAEVDGQALPLVVNDGNDSECYLTSPYINYIVYSLDFVRRLPQRRWRWPLHGIVALFATFVRRRDLDRVVYVNHWLVATGPRYALSPAQLDRLKTTLLRHFPNHAIVVRGVRADYTAQFVSTSPPLGWHALFNRNVYVWSHDHARSIKPSREFRQDRRRLDASRESVRMSAVLDSPQMAQLKSLYEQLYWKNIRVTTRNLASIGLIPLREALLSMFIPLMGRGPSTILFVASIPMKK